MTLTLNSYNKLVVTTFGEWIFEKILKYESLKKRRVTQTEFARHIGVSQSTLSNWMNETSKPSAEAALKLAAHFNDYEILDLLKYTRPHNLHITDDQLAPIAEAILAFPESLRPQIRTAILQALETIIESDQMPTEDETLKLLAAQILSINRDEKEG